MSSILKALKKLEEEQAGRSASSPTGSSGQFVAPMRAGQPLLLLVFGIGAGLLLAAGLYVLFGRSEIQTSPPPVLQGLQTDIPAAKAVPTSVTKVASGVAASVPVESPVRAKAPSVVTPVQPAAVNAIAPRAVVNRAPVAPPILPSPAPVTKTRIDQVEHVEVKRREIPSPGQQWMAPNLTVSEILPTSAEGRMAIVNGMPVMEGTLLDGVLVEKIGADQVVFVVDGRTVVVPLMQQMPVVDRQ